MSINRGWKQEQDSGASCEVVLIAKAGEIQAHSKRIIRQTLYLEAQSAKKKRCAEGPMLVTAMSPSCKGLVGRFERVLCSNCNTQVQNVSLMER